MNRLQHTFRAALRSRAVIAAVLALTAAGSTPGAAFAAGVPAAPPGVVALDRRAEDAVVVATGETVDDDLFAAGSLVRIDGTVRGDAFVFGRSVLVAGTVEGDLIVAGEQVTVEGRVLGDVRAAGAVLVVTGAVDGNVTAAAQVLQLGTAGRIGGNMIAVGESLTLGGDVGGSLMGSAEGVILQGRVGRDVEMGVASLTVAPTARVAGNLVYHARVESAVPPQAVAGQTLFNPRRETPQQVVRSAREGVERFLTAMFTFLSVAWLAGSAIAGLAVIRLFPRFVARFLDVLESRPLASVGLGALALVGALPVAVVLAVSLVGLPLAGLLVAAYFSAIFTGWLLLAAAVGSILVGLLGRGRPEQQSWAFLLGLLVLAVATTAPIIGGLLWFLAASFGLGALLVALYRTWHGPDLPYGRPLFDAAPAAAGGSPE